MGEAQTTNTSATAILDLTVLFAVVNEKKSQSTVAISR